MSEVYRAYSDDEEQEIDRAYRRHRVKHAECRYKRDTNSRCVGKELSYNKDKILRGLGFDEVA